MFQFVNVERFWARVRKPPRGGCWLWTGAHDADGYGKVKTRFHGGQRQLLSTHRFAYWLKHGEIPDGLLVCHKCDNAGCCNPAHLFIGTQADNIADKVSKDRQSKGSRHAAALRRRGPFERNPRRGEAHPLAKLTNSQVREIRRLSPGLSQRKIGSMFGVSHVVIGHVLLRKTWAHVQ